jgi:hypothetical protein
MSRGLFAGGGARIRRGRIGTVSGQPPGAVDVVETHVAAPAGAVRRLFCRCRSRRETLARQNPVAREPRRFRPLGRHARWPFPGEAGGPRARHRPARRVARAVMPGSSNAVRLVTTPAGATDNASHQRATRARRAHSVARRWPMPGRRWRRCARRGAGRGHPAAGRGARSPPGSDGPHGSSACRMSLRTRSMSLGLVAPCASAPGGRSSWCLSKSRSSSMSGLQLADGSAPHHGAPPPFRLECALGRRPGPDSAYLAGSNGPLLTSTPARVRGAPRWPPRPRR